MVQKKHVPLLKSEEKRGKAKDERTYKIIGAAIEVHK